MAGAGDMNADGYRDAIVGSHLDNEGGSTEGAARVYSGKDGSQLRVVVGSASYYFGFAVAGVGDVNNDGFDDFAVGAPRDSTSTLSQHGLVRVYSGKGGPSLHNKVGAATDQMFGCSVAGVGDLNGDGFDDFAVGSADTDLLSTNAGRVDVYSGATGGVLFTYSSAQAGSNLGFAVSSAGDVNGDGVLDVIVGSPVEDGALGVDAGAARVYSGKSGAALQTFLGPSAGARFGESVSGAGDVNGDGIADVIVGAPRHTQGAAFQTGMARVYSGAGALLHTFTGTTTNQSLGFAVAPAGDATQDGVADVLVGAPGEFVSGVGSATGAARLYAGGSWGLVHSYKGSAANHRFGTSTALVGDANGDARPDFAVGTRLSTADGYARVVTSVPGLKAFGTGTEGCVSRQWLSANGVPAVGSAGFAFQSSHAPNGGLGLLLLGDAANVAGNDPFALGALFHVDLALSTFLQGLDMPANAAGLGTTPVPLPANPALAGQKLVAQALWIWSTECLLPPIGMSSTAGLEVTFQP